MHGADMHGADLQGADLHRADMHGAPLALYHRLLPRLILLTSSVTKAHQTHNYNLSKYIATNKNIQNIHLMIEPYRYSI
jgi:uncharacterized protein YjbI with pentapeptide repeats